MEIIENLLSDKKTLIIMTIIYIIVVVFVLILIWMPKKQDELFTFEKYDADAKQNEMAEYYFNIFLNYRIYGMR